MSICELSRKLRTREISVPELTEKYIEKIEEKEESIHAYITLTPDEARKAALLSDSRYSKGAQLSALDGIPAGIKDNICTAGVRTTCASKMLASFVPCYSATVIEKLGRSGLVMLGKLNMDEFAMGSTTESSFFGATKNPADITCVPGGSSGGSAAAVAAGEAAYAIGSDTGGSIRQPAAFCGVVGMKPTYGRVSRFGLVAFASSLDQIGPLTKTVSDNALVFEAIAGSDGRDSTSVTAPGGFSVDIGRDIKGLRIGLPREFFGEGCTQQVRKAVYDAAGVFESLGAEIVDVSLPSLSSALSAYYIISSAEASSNLARFDGVRYGCRCGEGDSVEELIRSTRNEGFGDEVKRRIMLGSFALSCGYRDAYYKKAQQVRTLIRRDFSRLFESCDALLSPVAPTPAYKLGEKTHSPVEMYMGDVYSVPVNIAGIPSLALPCGKTPGGLPLGMQLMGADFSESLLYRIGSAYEEATK